MQHPPKRDEVVRAPAKARERERRKERKEKKRKEKARKSHNVCNAGWREGDSRGLRKEQRAARHKLIQTIIVCFWSLVVMRPNDLKDLKDSVQASRKKKRSSKMIIWMPLVAKGRW